jgi:Tol biopolymer transport system component
LVVIRSWATATIDDSAIGIVDLNGADISYRDAIDPVGAQEYLAVNPAVQRVTFSTTERVEKNQYRFGLFSWNWSTGDVGQILETEGPPLDSDWSPEGQTLAFASVYNGRSAIWTLSDGDRSPKVFAAASDAIRSPRWSPDGSALVAVQGVGTTSRLTFLVFPSGAGKEFKAFPSEVPCRDPDWGR